MGFFINASTKVPFTGSHYLHGYVRNQFSGVTGPNLVRFFFFSPHSLPPTCLLSRGPHVEKPDAEKPADKPRPIPRSTSTMPFGFPLWLWFPSSLTTSLVSSHRSSFPRILTVGFFCFVLPWARLPLDSRDDHEPKKTEVRRFSVSS